MKKFLCYDTNDAASGKINVSPNGVLKPNSTVLSTNGASYQQLVTDGKGGVKWEDRLAYDDSRVVVDATAMGANVKFVKVADEVPSWASIDAPMTIPMKIWLSNGIKVTVNPEDYLYRGNDFLVSEFAAFIAADNVEAGRLVYPEKGVYFSYKPTIYVTGIASADSDTPEITWDGYIGGFKKLDKKFIPSELNEVILPSSTSGSTKKFKITVDDRGAIAATEV